MCTILRHSPFCCNGNQDRELHSQELQSKKKHQVNACRMQASLVQVHNKMPECRLALCVSHFQELHIQSTNPCTVSAEGKIHVITLHYGSAVRAGLSSSTGPQCMQRARDFCLTHEIKKKLIISVSVANKLVIIAAIQNTHHKDEIGVCKLVSTCHKNRCPCW